MTIIDISDPHLLERAFPILKVLRPGLDFQKFIAIHNEAKTRDDFRFVGTFDGERCIALMGYRILFDYVHGKHLYIDDLVVAPERRSSGIGAMLLAFAEEKARELKCEGLRLCTGVDNEAGRRFYSRHGWEPRAFAFKKRLDSASK